MGEYNVLFYVPNIVGYARILLVGCSFYYVLDNYKLSLLFYSTSYTLDAVDSLVAKLFNHTSILWSILDMLIDRVSTMCLLMILGHLYLDYFFFVQILLAIDTLGHWMHFFTSNLKEKTQQKLSEGKIRSLIRLYYENKAIIISVCAMEQILYCSLVALKHEGPDASPYIIWIIVICVPAILSKNCINLLHIYSACRMIRKLGASNSNGKAKAYPHFSDGLWMVRDKKEQDNECQWKPLRSQLRLARYKETENSTGSGAGKPHLDARRISQEINLVDEIGHGGFGSVWRGEFKGQPVAVKIFSALSEASWEREVEIYQTTMLRHKNILGFIAADKSHVGDVTGYWLVTDYYPIGSLYDFLKVNSISMRDALRMAFSIANGLAHLHDEIFGIQGKPAMAHRDIKSKNILVKNDGTCCIADLGFAVRYDSKSKIVDVPANSSRAGTRRYMAPEMLENRLDLGDFEAIKATDIYALGLVLWEILRRTCSVSSGESTTSHQESRAISGNGSVVEGSSRGTDSFGDDMVESSTQEDGSVVICDPHELPYYMFVPADPTIDELREVVCVQKIRPTISYRWTKSRPMRDYSMLMSECWYENPKARLSALRVRKTSSEIAKRYFRLNLYDD